MTLDCNETVAVEQHLSPGDCDHPRCGRMPRWAVVRSHPQAERWADSNIRRLGYRTYLPLVLARRRDPVVRTLIRNVESPLFAGYLFVLHDPQDPWTPIRYAPGVAALLMDGSHLAYTHDGEIEALMDTEQSRLAPPSETLRAGSAVHVPALGADGVVLDIAGSKARVSVLMFAGLRTVTVPVSSLEPRDAA